MTAAVDKRQHTPGPWEQIDTMVVTPIKSGVMAIDATQSAPSIEESLANARLIAAAPDMKEELQAQLRWLRTALERLVHVPTADGAGRIVNGFAAAQLPDWQIKQRIEALEAAIAKARAGDAQQGTQVSGAGNSMTGAVRSEEDGTPSRS
jgi:hypothetical protein